MVELGLSPAPPGRGRWRARARRASHVDRPGARSAPASLTLPQSSARIRCEGSDGARRSPPNRVRRATTQESHRFTVREWRNGRRARLRIWWVIPVRVQIPSLAPTFVNPQLSGSFSPSCPILPQRVFHLEKADVVGQTKCAKPRQGRIHRARQVGPQVSSFRVQPQRRGAAGRRRNAAAVRSWRSLRTHEVKLLPPRFPDGIEGACNYDPERGDIGDRARIKRKSVCLGLAWTDHETDRLDRSDRDARRRGQLISVRTVRVADDPGIMHVGAPDVRDLALENGAAAPVVRDVRDLSPQSTECWAPCSRYSRPQGQSCRTPLTQVRKSLSRVSIA